MRLLTLASAVIILVNCSYPTVVRVDVPNRPELPRIVEHDLECLSDEAYLLLVEKDALQSTYIDTLIKIIDAHNESPTN